VPALEIAVERLAQAVDDRRVCLQAHADAQAVHQHAADHVALARLAGLLLDDRGHDQRLVRRLVKRGRGVARFPFLLQTALHRPVRAAQDREIARALAEEVSVR